MGRRASGSTPSAASSDVPPETEELRFEPALERLEELVQRLETAELSLEEALAAFEEGVRLSRHLAEALGRAERRVEVLLRENGELVARPFDDPGDSL